MSKQLLKGNQAIAMAAIKAGVDAYFGYPITRKRGAGDT
jgi:2-oxoglutarate ferredoxin oxidoreductase subunit alpha